MSWQLSPLRRSKRKRKRDRSSWGLGDKLHKHRKKYYEGLLWKEA